MQGPEPGTADFEVTMKQMQAFFKRQYSRAEDLEGHIGRTVSTLRMFWKQERYGYNTTKS